MASSQEPGESRDTTARTVGGTKRRRVRLKSLPEDFPELAHRLTRLREFSGQVRSSEYHVTNACNLRCEGCWFFEYEHDKASKELKSAAEWKQFAERETRERRMTAALLIGGEPSLYLDRVSSFISTFPYVTVSTNGLQAIPKQGFERLAIALTLFGGEEADDRLRAIKPSGARFTGLFDTVRRNYEGDPRATFVYALSPELLSEIEPTVRAIRDNGNLVTFNYYSAYGQEDPLRKSREDELLEAALAVQDAYPETVVCHPYFIRTLITGQNHHGTEFGYDVCPSISIDHPDHKERMRNGGPTLPGFNSFAADGETLNFCCTSGHCEGCRDSQAVYSWLMVSLRRFLGSVPELETWVSVAESYWRQFVWSPYHPSQESLPGAER